MKQKLPSDALTKPARRAPWIVGAVVAAGVVVSAVTFGPAFAAQFNPAPKPTVSAAPVDTAPTLSPDELASVQGAADAQQAQIAADAAAKAAADAAAAQAAADAAKKASQQTQTSSGLPRGAVVPSIPGTTSPDTTQCASGSASDNASGVAVCD